VRRQAPKENSAAAVTHDAEEADPRTALDIQTPFKETSGSSAAATSRPSRSLSSSPDETITHKEIKEEVPELQPA
jgi:hypothetical protein